SCPGLAGLLFLNLHTCSLGDEGVRKLAGSPHSGRLRGLDLMQNRITDDGVRALAGSPELGGLCWLRLRLNKLTDAGGEELLRWRPGSWATLDVAHAGVSKDVERRISAAAVLRS